MSQQTGVADEKGEPEKQGNSMIGRASSNG